MNWKSVLWLPAARCVPPGWSLKFFHCLELLHGLVLRWRSNHFWVFRLLKQCSWGFISSGTRCHITVPDVLRNIGIQLPSDVMWYPRKSETSSRLLPLTNTSVLNCIFDRGVLDTVSGESSHSWEDGTAPPYHAGEKSSSSGSPWSSLSPIHFDPVVSKVRVPLYPTEPCRGPRVWCRISWYSWRWANGHCWISNRWTACLRVKSAWTSCGLTKPNEDSQHDESLRVDDPL